jgi:hypothetical protein
VTRWHVARSGYKLIRCRLQALLGILSPPWERGCLFVS